MKSITIRAIFFQEGSWLVAQCLEFDIAAQAMSVEELKHEVERTLLLHLQASEESGREPFLGLPPAPRSYWEMYERAHVAVEANTIALAGDHPALPNVSPAFKAVDALAYSTQQI